MVAKGHQTGDKLLNNGGLDYWRKQYMSLGLHDYAIGIYQHW